MKKGMRLLVLLLTLVLVALLVRQVQWPLVAVHMRALEWKWLVVAQVFSWSSHFIRAQRWSYIVRCQGPASYRHLFSATMIGFLVNFTIPARLGELVRAYLLSRFTARPFGQSMAAVFLDRLNDLIGLLAILCVAFVGLPGLGEVVLPAELFGSDTPLVISSQFFRPVLVTTAILLVLGFLGIVVMVIFGERVVIVLAKFICLVSSRAAQLFTRASGAFLAGFKAFHSPADIASSIVFSLLTWGVSVLALPAILWAFDIAFPWYLPFVMLASIAAFITIPVTPGMLGQYHIGVIVALLICVPKVDLDQATAVAIVAHGLNLLPIAVMGAGCLILEHVSWHELRQSMQRKPASSQEGGALAVQATECKKIREE